MPRGVPPCGVPAGRTVAPLPLSVRHPPGWYVLCRAKDLGRKPIPVQFGDRQWVVFRTSTGRLGVLDDRCAHRGVALSGGSVLGECVKCPYHGWEYGTDGSVRLVPAMQHSPDSWPAIKLASIECTEQDGFVWGRVNDAGAETPHRFKNLGASGWTSFSMQTHFRADVASCLENFLDCPHAAFVHRHWFRTPTSKRVHCVVRTLESGAQAEFFEEPRGNSAVWWLLAPRKGHMRHVDRFIAPNTSEVEYEFPNGLHYIITSTCTPVSSDETMVLTVISFRVGRWLGPLVRLFFEPLSHLIIRQDVKMLARRHDNLARGGGTGFASTAADLLGPHIVAWRRALMSNTPPPPAGAESHVDITL